MTGDGDALAIGGNHFIHCMRRNLDLKIVMFNNRIYGLTKGQISPDLRAGEEDQVHPATARPTTRSTRPRSRSGGRDVRGPNRRPEGAHMGQVLKAARSTRAASYIEIFQNCPIFNDGAYTWHHREGGSRPDVSSCSMEDRQAAPLRQGHEEGDPLQRRRPPSSRS